MSIGIEKYVENPRVEAVGRKGWITLGVKQGRREERRKEREAVGIEDVLGIRNGIGRNAGVNEGGKKKGIKTERQEGRMELGKI